VCATNLDYTFFLRIEIGCSHLQADEEPNHDRRPHRLPVCALPIYSDPRRLHLIFRVEIGWPPLQTDEEMNHDRRPHRLLVCALPI